MHGVLLLVAQAASSQCESKSITVVVQMIRKRNVTLGWNLRVYPFRHAGLGQVSRRAAAVTRNVNFPARFAREKRSFRSRVTLAALAFYEAPRTVTLCMAQDYVEPADLASRMPNTFTNHLNYYGIAICMHTVALVTRRIVAWARIHVQESSQASIFLFERTIVCFCSTCI
jgi:hypothetical protein